MSDDKWVWAPLNEREVQSVEEAEQAIGAGYVIAYRKGQASGATGGPGLKPAALDAGQLERVRRLEKATNSVVVAYSR